jgi:hypothetical protein
MDIHMVMTFKIGSNCHTGNLLAYCNQKEAHQMCGKTSMMQNVFLNYKAIVHNDYAL